MNITRKDGRNTLSSSIPRAIARRTPTAIMAVCRVVKTYRIGKTNPKRWILLRLNSRAMILSPTFHVIFLDDYDIGKNYTNRHRLQKGSKTQGKAVKPT
jgi:hypothetical protein